MKQKLFFRDFKLNQNISYLQLYNDILNTNRYNIYCKSDDYYTVFKNVVLSIVLGKEVVLLDADFSEDELNPDESEVRGQRKIRSIGSLVNFVIAKVDKREDKLIEFKDSDEGSEVSGINLGLVKIKGKK